VLAFVVLYIGIFIVGAALLAIDARVSNVNLDITDAIAASAGTLGNVGPGLGFAGPMGSYAPFSDFSKLVMALLMWVGRLEVLPVLVLLTRGYWRV
jgi:trk system potassium uptake protein TrkH